MLRWSSSCVQTWRYRWMLQERKVSVCLCLNGISLRFPVFISCFFMFRPTVHLYICSNFIVLYQLSRPTLLSHLSSSFFLDRYFNCKPGYGGFYTIESVKLECRGSSKTVTRRQQPSSASSKPPALPPSKAQGSTWPRSQSTPGKCRTSWMNSLGVFDT